MKLRLYLSDHWKVVSGANHNNLVTAKTQPIVMQPLLELNEADLFVPVIVHDPERPREPFDPRSTTCKTKVPQLINRVLRRGSFSEG